VPSEGSVTHWFKDLQVGDPAAAQRLWERYFLRLASLARKRLKGVVRRVADEEDVALSAFDSFCRNAEEGRFPQIVNRDGLWRLLVVLTARKASHLTRDQKRQKRGALATVVDDEAIWEQLLSREPDPAFAAQVVEEYRRLLGRLGDPELEAVATWRLEGYTVEEIARRMECVPRSIKRKLHLIRDIWSNEVET
jgi:DNA-directed RNA polymerase specialized sigma24 family protein